MPRLDLLAVVALGVVVVDVPMLRPVLRRNVGHFILPLGLRTRDGADCLPALVLGRASAALGHPREPVVVGEQIGTQFACGREHDCVGEPQPMVFCAQRGSAFGDYGG